MPEAAWRIIEEDAPPSGWTGSVMFTCPKCGHDARLPVQGSALAQLREGDLVFDVGDHAIPKIIQCRHCRKRFERAA
jgi:hypothetical protein